jgi:hypothetical protein
VGDALETFKIVNVNFREDKGLLKYGDQVALYNYAAGGKYLAVDPATGVVSFKRNAFGMNEKWTVVDVSASAKSPSSSYVMSSSMLAFKSSATGMYNIYIYIYIMAHFIR